MMVKLLHFWSAELRNRISARKKERKNSVKDGQKHL